MQRLQIHVFYGNKSVTEHVNASHTLLQDDVANQRLEFAIFGLHIDKSHFVKNSAKAFYLNTNRTAYFGFYHLLRGGLNFDFRNGFEITEAILPSAGKHH